MYLPELIHNPLHKKFGSDPLFRVSIKTNEETNELQKQISKHLICKCLIWTLFIVVIFVQLAASERQELNSVWAKKNYRLGRGAAASAQQPWSVCLYVLHQSSFVAFYLLCSRPSTQEKRLKCLNKSNFNAMSKFVPCWFHTPSLRTKACTHACCYLSSSLISCVWTCEGFNSLS